MTETRPRIPFDCFVSYGHEDEKLVVPIMELVRAVTGQAVFRDRDSITPGRQWRSEIATALAEIRLLIVFWCEHAETSREVRWEVKTAKDLGKHILPILLGNRPLRWGLSRYQYIDFRPSLHHIHMEGFPHAPLFAALAGDADPGTIQLMRDAFVRMALKGMADSLLELLAGPHFAFLTAD